MDQFHLVCLYRQLFQQQYHLMKALPRSHHQAQPKLARLVLKVLAPLELELVLQLMQWLKRLNAQLHL